jgi:hypothetical protein
MVITFAAQCAETPAGKPLAPETPSFVIAVAPVVAIVIFVSKVLIQRVGVDDGTPAVFAGVTVIVPVALTAEHPPVNGML